MRRFLVALHFSISISLFAFDRLDPPEGTRRTFYNEVEKCFYYYDMAGEMLGGYNETTGNFVTSNRTDAGYTAHYIDTHLYYDVTVSPEGEIILIRHEGESQYHAGFDPMRGMFTVTYTDEGIMTLDYTEGHTVTGDAGGSYLEVGGVGEPFEGVYHNAGTVFGEKLERGDPPA